MFFPFPQIPIWKKKRPDCDSEVVDAAAADGVDRCRTITRQMDVLSFTWPLRVNASLSYLQGMIGNDSSEDRGGRRSFSETRPRLSRPSLFPSFMLGARMIDTFLTGRDPRRESKVAAF